MINLRYHIVSLTAVFLALSLGILLGSAVLSGALVDRLESDISRVQGERGAAQRAADELEGKLGQSSDLIESLAPRVTEGVLVGMSVVFVTGESEADWHARVRDVITDAGADDVGSIELTTKWSLEKPTDRDELIRAFGSRTLNERDPAADAARQLGELLPGDATELLASLSDAGFVRSAPADADALFPPPTAQVVVLASPDDAPLASLALGAAQATATLVVAGDVDNLGPVATLRRREEATGRLATFDSASADPAGVGTVLALRAAADNAGGHFGLGAGLRFLPAPP